MAKRIKDNRAKKREQIKNVLEANKQRLLQTLAKIAEGKTPPQVADAYVDFYFNSDMKDRFYLSMIFEEIEEKQITDICYYYAGRCQYSKSA